MRGFDAALGEDGAAGDSAADNSARGNVLTLSPWVDHASCEHSQMSFPSKWALGASRASACDILVALLSPNQGWQPASPQSGHMRKLFGG